ncbi:hypothetical protein D3C87_324900 [compost metagenome]
MKPFDLEAAKRGDPLITRGGEVVKFIAHVPEAKEGYKVVALVEGIVRSFGKDGKWMEDDITHLDLFMAPKKKTVWVNFYGFTDGSGYTSNAHISQAHADAATGPHSGRIGGKAYPVEIDD